MPVLFPRRFESVLFDLDGTLADTAPDLAIALNSLLALHQRPALPTSLVREHVSQGSAALTRLGFPDIVNAEDFESLRLKLLDLYSEKLCVETRLFEGTRETLCRLESCAIPWGIVTNKPGWLTDPLLEHLLGDLKPHCVVSGDTLAQRKPHPEPLLLACQRMQCTSHASMYIGDDPRDVYAGNAAGMYTCIAAYGYTGSTREDIELWGADIIIDHPTEIFNYIELQNLSHDMAT